MVLEKYRAVVSYSIEMIVRWRRHRHLPRRHQHSQLIAPEALDWPVAGDEHSIS
jgi:hypothetical protein